jgi:hypothetical protein
MSTYINMFYTFCDYQGGQMCHFPFKYENRTYTSCAHVNITGFNLQGEPWCATEVESDGITVKEYKWSLCQDERGLILDGEGNKINNSFYFHVL